MKRRNIYLIFCAILVAFIIIVLCIKPTPEFLFANATGDCSGRSTFMYNALYNNNTNSDVVFFGSSQTMNGVNDSLVNSFGTTIFLNLGYCRYGRNLDYYFIERYCRQHRPQKIILEVRETEGDNTHAVTPFFLPVSDIAASFVTGNADVFKELYNKWLCNLKFIRGNIFGNELSVLKMPVTQGFWQNRETGNIIRLNSERLKDSLFIKQEIADRKSLNRNSTFYFKKLKTLAAQKKIMLYFLYLGRYGNQQKRPAQERDYMNYGKVLIPPDSIFCDPQNFSNVNHLNNRGAAKLSLWLSAELNKE